METANVEEQPLQKMRHYLIAKFRSMGFVGMILIVPSVMVASKLNKAFGGVTKRQSPGDLGEILGAFAEARWSPV